MKNKYCMLISILFVLFGLLNSAQSADTYPNSGVWMFTLNGNDSNYDLLSLETAIEQWFESNNQTRDISLEFYDKVEDPETSGSFMTVTYASDKLSGTWSTIKPIEFYSIKAADQFAFYWVEGGADSGTWNTEDLSVIKNKKDIIPQISHLSTWNSLENPGNTVPEPATLILLGFGLIGLSGAGRRTLKNQ